MSEPYVIKAGEFDPERQERHFAANGKWSSSKGSYLNDSLLIVRDRPPTLEDVMLKHWEWRETFSYPPFTCNGCSVEIGDEYKAHVKHVADELRKAGLVNG